MVDQIEELTWDFWSGPRVSLRVIRRGWGREEGLLSAAMAALLISDTAAKDTGIFQKGSISHFLKLTFANHYRLDVVCVE